MPRDLLKILSLWVPPIIWAGLIFILSSTALPATSDFYWNDFVVKKSGHIFVYAVLGFLLFRALIGEGVGRKKALIWAFLIATLYGVTDEIHQSFTPGRGPTVRDTVVDAIGSLIGVYFAKMKLV